MQAVHTAALPPRTGNTILANIGSTKKSKAALKNMVKENAATAIVDDLREPGSAGPDNGPGFKREPGRRSFWRTGGPANR
jgi:hypothetical protein